MKKVIIIDNYDSFTYNLVHLVEEIIQDEVTVVRNDQFELMDVEAYDYIILSPGPGVPSEAGLLKDVIKIYKDRKKIMGVCLGLQAIGEVYGASLINLQRVWHGMKTTMTKTAEQSLLLKSVPTEFDAGRYHSWVIDRNSDTSELVVTAVDGEGNIMAARHHSDKVYGVQFHPESIMTEHGRLILTNFLNS